MQIFAHSQGLRYAPIGMLNRNVWNIELCGRFSVTINSELLGLRRMLASIRHSDQLQLVPRYPTSIVCAFLLNDPYSELISCADFSLINMDTERVNIATTTSSLNTKIEVFH